MTSLGCRLGRPLLLSALLCAWPLFSALAVGAPGTLAGYEIVRLGRGPGNRLCMAASVGGKKGLMILDTGANGSVLSDSTYGFLKGKTSALYPNLPKTAGFNWTTALVTVAPDFTVGKTNLGTFPVRLVPNRLLFDRAMMRSGGTDHSYDGLLGEEVLRHYHAVVDCGRMALYLNTVPSRQVAFGPGFARAGWTAVPMDDLKLDFTVNCSINGHRFRLIVDTGAPFTTVNRRLIDSIHLDSQVVNGLKMGIVGTRVSEIGMSTVEGMKVGNYSVPKVHLVVSPASFADFGDGREDVKEGPVAGFLGGDALAANGGIVDTGNRTLYLRGSVRSQ